MLQYSQMSDLVIDKKKAHNFCYYCQNLQKLKIHSNTDLIYNVRVQINENRRTHHLSLDCQDDHFEPTCNLRYWLVRYQTILMNLGTIKICKSYQICWLHCTPREDFFFRNYVQWHYLDSSEKWRSCSRIYFF